MREAKRLNRKRIVIKQRIFVALILGIILIILGLYFKSILTDAHGNSSEDPATYQYYTSIQVQEGDTLYSIASKYRSPSDESTNYYINKLKDMNHLSSDDIHTGQYLMIAYEDSELK